MWKCKHCNKQFENFSTSEKANHSKWCDANPKRNSYNNDLIKARSCKKKFNNQFTKAKELGLKIPIHSAKGKPGISRKHTKETKDLISEKARASKHRRLLRSIREYVKLDGSIVKLDSAWEELLAKRLDELNIKWIRPEIPVEWTDKSGKTHNYFPDFYLEEYNLFLDPKNPFAYSRQKDKIEIILQTLNNLLILKTEDECKNFKP